MIDEVAPYVLNPAGEKGGFARHLIPSPQSSPAGRGGSRQIVRNLKVPLRVTGIGFCPLSKNFVNFTWLQLKTQTFEKSSCVRIL